MVILYFYITVKIIHDNDSVLHIHLIEYPPALHSAQIMQTTVLWICFIENGTWYIHNLQR